MHYLLFLSLSFFYSTTTYANQLSGWTKIQSLENVTIYILKSNDQVTFALEKIDSVENKSVETSEKNIIEDLVLARKRSLSLIGINEFKIHSSQLNNMDNEIDLKGEYLTSQGRVYFSERHIFTKTEILKSLGTWPSDYKDGEVVIKNLETHLLGRK